MPIDRCGDKMYLKITVDKRLIKRVDDHITQNKNIYNGNRSLFISSAIEEKLRKVTKDE